MRPRASLSKARRWWPGSPALALPALLLIAVAACTGSSAPPENHPTSAAAEPAFGVNVDLRGRPSSEVAATFAELASAGIRTVRQPVAWADVEATAGRDDWAALDELVTAAEAHEVRLLLALNGAPEWARNDPPAPDSWWLCSEPAVTGPTAARAAPATDPAAFAGFAELLAERYAGRLWAIEVWPEPNLLPNWHATGPDPEAYGLLLAETARRIHAAAPDTLVVSGGLAPTTDLGVCFLSDVVFLDRLARTGALSAVDAVGIEPFGLRAAPLDGPADREVLNFRRAEVLRAVLEKHAVSRPLWAVAWGWNALPKAWPGYPVASPWGSHPAATAADWTRTAAALARTSWPWLGPMFLSHYQPAAATGDPVWGFALKDRDGQQTDAWSAAADIAAGRTGPLPVPEAPRPSPRQLSLTALVLAALLVLALRRWLSPMLRALLLRAARVPVTWQIVAFAGAALLDIFGPWPASLLALPILGLVAATTPAIALAAVAFAVPFYYGLDMWVGPQAFDGVEFLLLAAIGGRLAAWYARPPADQRSAGIPAAVRRAVRRWHWSDWLVLALVAWAAATLAWSEFRAPAIRQWRTVILEPALLYALLRSHRDRRAVARLALDALTAGAAAASLWALLGLGLFALGVGDAGVRAEGVLRATGPYASPNNLALLLGRLLPVVGVYALWSQGRRRLAYRLAAIPIGLALLATFSRAALLLGLPMTAGYLALLALRQADRRRLAWVAAGLVGAAALLLPFARTERVAGAFRLSPGGTGYIRMRLWQSALNMGRDHPWGGVGLDNFLYLYRDRYVQRDAVQDRFLNHPHNWLLDWWTRLGLVGLALFVGLVAANAQAGLRGLRRVGSTRLLAAAALGMQLYALAHGLLDNSFFLVDLAAVWWIGQAALLAAAEDKSTKPPA
jgi:O-antigen ligase